MPGAPEQEAVSAPPGGFGSDPGPDHAPRGPCTAHWELWFQQLPGLVMPEHFLAARGNTGLLLEISPNLLFDPKTFPDPRTRL